MKKLRIANLLTLWHEVTWEQQGLFYFNSISSSILFPYINLLVLANMYVTTFQNQENLLLLQVWMEAEKSLFKNFYILSYHKAAMVYVRERAKEREMK